MKETIGNVKLDYTCYPGEDLYSDGAVEDELLEIAKEFEESQWNRVIAERESWPILYHYSHIRKNIINWLPVSGEERVLEIGSGCGAITGALAEKAKQVTCVELSRKRSHINAYRHREKDNIEILVGNFQDIEKSLGQYDLITLIGVFEYSNGYIGGDRPFVDMLKIIRKHLTQSGRLVIAIENRLGLKYWAGCTEDHTGTWFEGIEDYPNTDSVHTFSLKEIREVVAEAEGFDSQMYYPYPDYKFPMQIFSDDRLPKIGELKELNYNFDRARMVLFDEIRAADSLIRNDLFPEYSNSFLLVLTREGAEVPKEQCIYAKYSNERAEQFSTRTEIWKTADGGREVRKIADTEKSKEFVSNMAESYSALTDQYRDFGIRMNHCKALAEGVAFTYTEGETLEQLLDQALAEGRVSYAKELILAQAELLRKAASVPFVMTDAFKAVFGDAVFDRELLCPPVADIDPICSNWIRRKDGWELLDYEWSFSFPVPVDFQIFRMLHYYLYSSTSRTALADIGLFQSAGISDSDIAVFEQMEQQFQNYIRQGRVPMRDMYETISPGVFFDIRSIGELQRKADARKIQIYADQGRDFSEENSWHLKTEDGCFKGVVRIPEHTVRLRIDPCEENCIVELKEYCFSDGIRDTEIPVVCTGRVVKEHTYYFADNDPYFLLDIPEGTEQIRLDMKIHYLGSGEKHPVSGLMKEKEALQKMLDHERMVVDEAEKNSRHYSEQAERRKRENKELKRELAELKQQLQEIEHSKVWKVYSRIKGNK
ncbi:MAG: class I SAM-dependent methyltransferase [Lachnospiraceae bacterium]|nr:class I SAM-dependent methyltransferase [Lachnospiraceae bacterium]